MTTQAHSVVLSDHTPQQPGAEDPLRNTSNSGSGRNGQPDASPGREPLPRRRR